MLNQQYCSVFTREDMISLPEAENKFFFSEDHELQDIQFTKEKVKAKLSKLKPSSAPGPDHIWPRILNKLAGTLHPTGNGILCMYGRGFCPPRLKTGKCHSNFQNGGPSQLQTSVTDVSMLQSYGEHHQG